MSAGWQVWKRTTRLPLLLTLDNGLLFVADPRSGNSAGAIYTRIYESVYTQFIRKTVVAGGMLCDVGAHVGLFTLLLAPLFRSGFCFEPAPDTFELLCRNLRLNGLVDFEPRRQAVSSERGSSVLVAEGPYSGGARLIPDARPVAGASRALTVETVALDDVLPPDRELTFLKIDVEGHEPEVLLGARNVLARAKRGLVMFEQNGEPALMAVAILRDVGWSPFLLDASGTPTTSLEGIGGAYNVFACGPQHPLSPALS